MSIVSGGISSGISTYVLPVYYPVWLFDGIFTFWSFLMSGRSFTIWTRTFRQTTLWPGSFLDHDTRGSTGICETRRRPARLAVTPAVRRRAGATCIRSTAAVRWTDRWRRRRRRRRRRRWRPRRRSFSRVPVACECVSCARNNFCTASFRVVCVCVEKI